MEYEDENSEFRDFRFQLRNWDFCRTGDHPSIQAMRLEMYGEDPMTAGIQVRIAANPARESVRFAGHIAHATDAFAAMDLLVLPSLLDGQPATIMEANTSGILVNANPVGGVPALIEERREAFLISLRRPERVVALLTEWAAEPARFAALRETVACTDRAVSYLP